MAVKDADAAVIVQLDLGFMVFNRPKKRAIVESGDGGLGLGIATFIANGEDLGPIIRHSFESGKPEALMQNLRSIVKKKEVEIEELCRLHYEDFIFAVDELCGEASADQLLKLDELLELYSVKKNVGEAITTLKICVELVKKVVPRQIPLIKLHIEKKVCSEFNDWLVHIRRMAKQIGQASISQASLAYQKGEEMCARQREAEAHSHAGPDEHLYALDLENTEEESTLYFDLTPVYRAHHMHTCLGMEDKFRDYYYKNRLMQLNLDMQISTSQPFLESHQPFLAQSQVETTWETSIGKITSILEEQFSRMRTANHFLLIKDYVTLLGAAVNKYGYRITQLIEVLEKSRDKYHQLLLLEEVNWIAEEAPDNVNDYMNEVLIYLETLVSTAQEILPLEALYKVVSGAMSHISDSIMTTLLNDGVKRFTVNAVLGIDIDLKTLEAFADDKFDSTGCQIWGRKRLSGTVCSQPENFMNPVIRQRNYGSLDYKKLAIICEKYKDSADSLFGSLSNRNTPQQSAHLCLDDENSATRCVKSTNTIVQIKSKIGALEEIVDSPIFLVNDAYQQMFERKNGRLSTLFLAMEEGFLALVSSL
ncbi:Exocyst complex component SEC15A [Zea mays]|uniref:Exocyst complex component SEC15A n=1 Tax=Zea mays TaxID=4577 RepID=A0A317Y8W4_MAIZE|nr:Exocyst complex component SEC15A [Zea mays]